MAALRPTLRQAILGLGPERFIIPGVLLRRSLGQVFNGKPDQQLAHKSKPAERYVRGATRFQGGVLMAGPTNSAALMSSISKSIM